MIRPKMVETTALGAAMAAAFTLQLWDLQSNEMSSTALRPPKSFVRPDILSPGVAMVTYALRFPVDRPPDLQAVQVYSGSQVISLLMT